MDQNELYEKMKEYALESENYSKWRDEHTKIFGKLFSEAFAYNIDGQICLTAALINISSKNFQAAVPKLNTLEQICDNEADRVSVWYFKGLNLEFMGKEDEMAENYEKVRQSAHHLDVGYLFYPYYRTAKLAQKSSECSKAIYYYKKALAFLEGESPRGNDAVIAGQIMYDIATVFLYMHEYGQCRRFLEFSLQYDKSKNHQRDYVKAILLAVEGKNEECRALVGKMVTFLRGSCKVITDAIISGSDLHYCKVVMDRSCYQDFWSSFEKDYKDITSTVISQNADKHEDNISQRITNTLSFARRPLQCQIEISDGKTVVKCKNYRIKTLMEEYSALFSLKPAALSDFEFLSVDEFEVYPF